MSRSAYNDIMQRAAPSEALIQDTKDKMEASIAKMRLPGHSRNLIAIAAVLIVALSTTTIALGGEIAAMLRQISFGRSEATQVESLGDGIGPHIAVMSGSELEVEVNYGEGLLEAFDEHTRYTLFETMEEARSAVPFELTEPAYLPESVIGFGGAYVYYFIIDQAPDKNIVSFWYDIDIPNIYGIPGGRISLWQEYIGPEAYIEMTTISTVERVMVGDIEAVFSFADSSTDSLSDSDPFRGWARCSITWIKNGFLFELTNSAIWAESLYDLDTMIAIAASV